ncbi:hypothetical protein GCM10020219_081420 [Nonomuraea dietziae]
MGAELEPVFAALRTWGMRSPVVPLTGGISADTVLLGLRAFFVPQPDASWTATYRIALGRDVYRVEVVDGELGTVARGQDPGPCGRVHRRRPPHVAVRTEPRNEHWPRRSMTATLR